MWCTQNAFTGVPWISAQRQVSLSLQGSLPWSRGQQLEQAEKPGAMGRKQTAARLAPAGWYLWNWSVLTYLLFVLEQSAG